VFPGVIVHRQPNRQQVMLVDRLANLGERSTIVVNPLQLQWVPATAPACHLSLSLLPERDGKRRGGGMAPTGAAR